MTGHLSLIRNRDPPSERNTRPMPVNVADLQAAASIKLSVPASHLKEHTLLLSKHNMPFTPEVLLSAPRRSLGVPNPRGDAVLYTQQTYDFETHQNEILFRRLDTKTDISVDVTKNQDIEGFSWLNNEAFVFLQLESGGFTNVCIGDATGDRGTYYMAGTLQAPVSHLRVAKLPPGHDGFAIVFVAQASRDGRLFNPQCAKEYRSTGRLYSDLLVRHWDRLAGNETDALFFLKLSKCDHNDRYGLGEITNVLKDTGLECPIPPFGGLDHFDLRSNHIILVAKDPTSNPSLSTQCHVYIIDIDASTERVKKPRKVTVPDHDGACTSPVIARDGTKAAFLSMQKNGYEADRNNIFMVSLDGDQLIARKLHVKSEESKDWDRSPSSTCFAANGKSLFAVAEECGNAKMFLLEAKNNDSPLFYAKTLTDSGCVASIVLLDNGSVFISGSTFIDSSFYSIVDPCSPSQKQTLWSNLMSDTSINNGLHPNQVSSIWTPASNPSITKEIHSIIIKPSIFDSNQKYPVAYIIHGGPQGCRKDSWDLRWNLHVFAEHGYIVVAPNITGSTGYGQAFTDAINANYGGDPCQDIVNCFDWIGGNLPWADNERAVALGNSFGGYMMNWIQGHDLGRKLKALVSHNGFFTMTGLLSFDELFAQFNDIGGIPWQQPQPQATSSDIKRTTKNATQIFPSTTLSAWRKWDPSEHITHWTTPQLVIANSKDYRLPISQGLAVFNILQTRGIESQLLTFPDENHWVVKPENALVWYKVVLNWVNKHVGLPPYTADDPASGDFWGGEEFAAEK